LPSGRASSGFNPDDAAIQWPSFPNSQLLQTGVTGKLSFAPKARPTRAMRSVVALWALSFWEKWSERGDLNSRPPVPQTGALTGLRYAPTFRYWATCIYWFALWRQAKAAKRSGILCLRFCLRSRLSILAVGIRENLAACLELVDQRCEIVRVAAKTL
jgi:hypothetical protein